MTIILQHQFWDLVVTDHGFEVGLSFGGIPEKLVIPFEAINGFFDPSVQFGLQFEEVTEGHDHIATPSLGQENSADKKKRRPPSVPRVPAQGRGRQHAGQGSRQAGGGGRGGQAGKSAERRRRSRAARSLPQEINGDVA